MTTKSDQETRRTALVPVTTMEEIPVLSPQEHAELIDSLEIADAQIEAGNFVQYDPEAFDERLLDIDRNARRAQNV